MARRDFTVQFEAFVKKHIHSVEQIEVLLLLRAEPQRVWSVPAISATLRSSPHSITERISGLVKRGMAVAEKPHQYRYSASGRLDEMVSLLAREYAERRFSVIELVFAKPDAARSFADAFLLREDDPE